MEVDEYPQLTTPELLTHLARVTKLLIAAHSELAFALQEEHNAKIAGYFSSESQSISGREWDAKNLAKNATLSRFDLEADIQQLTEEKFLILRILDEKRAQVTHGSG